MTIFENADFWHFIWQPDHYKQEKSTLRVTSTSDKIHIDQPGKDGMSFHIPTKEVWLHIVFLEAKTWFTQQEWDASDNLHLAVPSLVQQCFYVLFSLNNHNLKYLTAKIVALFDCFCSAKVICLNAHTQQVCAFFEKNKSKIYLKPILSCVLVPIIM